MSLKQYYIISISLYLSGTLSLILTCTNYRAQKHSTLFILGGPVRRELSGADPCSSLQNASCLSRKSSDSRTIYKNRVFVPLVNLNH